MSVIKGATGTTTQAKTLPSILLADSPCPIYPQFPHLIVALGWLPVEIGPLSDEADPFFIPHFEQNSAPSSIFVPQFGQYIPLVSVKNL